MSTIPPRKKSKLSSSSATSLQSTGGSKSSRDASPAQPVFRSDTGNPQDTLGGQNDRQATGAVIDAYRPLPNVYKKPLLRFTTDSSSSTSDTPVEPPTAASLLGLAPVAYSSRLSNRNILLSAQPSPEPGTRAYTEWLEAQESARRGKKTRRMKVVSKGGEGVWEVAKGGDGIGRVGFGWEKEGKKVEELVAVKTVEEKEPTGLNSSRKGKRQKDKTSAKKKRKPAALLAGSVISYNQLLPLHYLHLSYLSELLSLPSYKPLDPPPSSSSSFSSTTPSSSRLPNGLGTESLLAKMVKADFTGSRVRVKSAKNDCLIGIEGLVVQETAETIKLVTEKNVVKVIPKANSLFTMVFPAYGLTSIPHAPGMRWYAEGTSGGGPTDIDVYATDPFSTASSLLSSDYSGPTAKSDAQFEFDTSTPHAAFLAALEQVPHIELDILGTAICTRAADRAGKRFKYSVGGSGWADDWLPDSLIV